MVVFDTEGNIVWAEKLDKKEEPYIAVLRCMRELPFGVGKRLLLDILQGNEGNKSVRKHKFHLLVSFASLAYDDDELFKVLSQLEDDGFIYYDRPDNKPWTVLALTKKGEKELEKPSFYKTKKIKKYDTLEISEKDKVIFNNFSFFLDQFNDEQKLAIVSPKKTLLCVAGAGSGKTTVLTKRIEFLVKFKSVDERKILAITFTRKARQEMQKRLKIVGIHSTKVETFNSFCEKVLQKYEKEVYGKQVRMMSYGDKIKILKDGLASFQISVQGAIESFFTRSQRKGKSDDELFGIFLNDCYFIVDYFKSKGKEIEDFSLKAKDPMGAKLVYNLCRYIQLMKEKHGLRDHMDQVVDALRYFKENPDLIPDYEHILVDEYQDVNDLQIDFIETLNSNNLFCVGDPRQAIFGWRGSNISYILNFKEKFPEAGVISLTKNYRSSKAIVDLMNESISVMKLPHLEAVKNGDKNVKLLQFADENVEFEFVVQSVLASIYPRKEIFVLARTNRQLKELSYLFQQRGISHVLKSNELKKTGDAQEGQVTLATVHAIKGLEASLVFVIGCSYLNFPCRGSEHPVVELIKVDEYDKDEEERRLFYVALSRAKEQLCLTYNGKRHTSYINANMQSQLQHVQTKIPDKKRSWYQNSSLKEFVR